MVKASNDYTEEPKEEGGLPIWAVLLILFGALIGVYGLYILDTHFG